jgi:hypothetical protein
MASTPVAKKKPVFAQSGVWAAGLADKPVFIDGLTHKLFYLIVAAKTSSDDYQTVVIGKFGPDQFKVKMYGCFEDWGFLDAGLQDKFNARDFLSRKGRGAAGYERYMTDRAGVMKLMEALGQTRNVTICNPQKIMGAYDTTYAEREAITNQLHPSRGANRPRDVFKLPDTLKLVKVATW